MINNYYILIVSWIKFTLFVITSKITIANKVCMPPYMIRSGLEHLYSWWIVLMCGLAIDAWRCPLLRCRPPGSPHAQCPALPSVSIRHFRWMPPPCFRHSPSTKTRAFIGKFDVFMSGHNRTSDGDIRSRDDELIDFNGDSNDNNEGSV